MGWWRRKKPQERFGYEDRAALKGFGGYEPADPADATPGYLQPAFSGTQASTPAPEAPESRETPGPRAGDPPARPARRRGGAGGPFGCVLTLMALIGIGAVFVDSGEEGSGAPTPASPVPMEAPESSAPPPETVVPPVVAGWQSVAGSDGVYAYDVPRSWSARPGTLHGWRSEPGLADVTLATSAFLDEGYCAADRDRRRGGSGVTVAEPADTARAAGDTAVLVARHAYTAGGDRRPRLSVGEPERTTLSFGGGRREATVRFVEVTLPAGHDPCLPDTALVGAIAVEPPDGGDSDGDGGGNGGDGGTPVLVVYADQGYRGAPTREQLTRTLESLRWVPEEDRSTVPPTPAGPATPVPTG